MLMFQHFSAGKSQVISLEAMGKHLYITTSWGCIIIADAYNMEPLSIFRCHLDATHCIKPTVILLTFRDPHDLSEQDSNNPLMPAVSTIGRGYHDVMEGLKRALPARIQPPECDIPNYMLIWSAVGWKESSKGTVLQISDHNH